MASVNEEMKSKERAQAPSIPHRRLRVLHLFGSAVSDYYSIVSTKYACECDEGTRADKGVVEDFEYVYACVHPKAPKWSFPESLSEEARAKAPRVDEATAISKLKALQIDVCVPHMFCYPGMTTYRSLLDFLNIPFVGCPPDAMALTTHKGQSRGVMEHAGIRVPKGELLTLGDNEKVTISPPLILKPCREDNSMGVNLVMKTSDIQAGLESAFKFDNQILCEEFVPLGRELRIGAIEDENGNIRVLPCMEYHLPKEKPIRASTDKLTEDKKGLPSGFAKTVTSCPAKVDSDLQKKLESMVAKAHKALGCRDYSLYDVRVSPEGEAYFLEAGLYCSFSPRSIVVNLCRATGDPDLSYHSLFRMLVKRAAARKEDPANAETQTLGMMKRR